MSRRRIYLDVTPTFKPGDPPPEGYLAWHEWAEVQRKAGIQQRACGICLLWNTPQEMSDKVIRSQPKTSAGVPMDIESPVCLKCAK